MRPLILLAGSAYALCPYMNSGAEMPLDHPPMAHHRGPRGWRQKYRKALEELDFEAVKTDLKALFLDSKAQWPADYNNYGPLFVRLAWHNAGSYRTSDGRGGADGGRQRFDPERSWEDNTNLDKARALLQPIKIKYGVGLSWGDLIILAGNTAIESMGGPILGFCGGRVDDPDGYWSQELGPTEKQVMREPCPVNGRCEKPLGSTTVGLIYLNPEGPVDDNGVPQPIPEKTAMEVRDSFGRMSMNDTETVALIGGGHAFGKTHGACPAGPGKPPNEDPMNPWAGNCGSGKGADAWTSGFEGPWTTKPTTWDNEYFQNLVNHDWEPWRGPGGKFQWRTTDPAKNPRAPGPQGGTQKTMMMTSDISLLRDPEGMYPEIVKAWAADINQFDHHFKHAWYKLTTRDMGPVERCFGNDVPPAQPFQYPLPAPPNDLPDFDQVKAAIIARITNPADVELKRLGGMVHEHISPDRLKDGSTNTGALFVRLAWQCASTFRVTDFRGGCNGARIRFCPEKDWDTNKGLDAALMLLQPIKDKFGDNLTWADLIVLAGTTSLEQAGGKSMTFCGGRSDALDGQGSENLEPRLTGDITDTADLLHQTYELMGLTAREFVALMGTHGMGMMHAERSGYEGKWTETPAKLSNQYYTTLLTEEWEEYLNPTTGKIQYKAKGKDIYVLKMDLLLRYDPELLSISQDFASDNDLFLEALQHAWTKMMIADRFDGPVGNKCETHSPHVVKASVA